MQQIWRVWSRFLWTPNPIDQLVAALCDAGLSTDPGCRRGHGLDPRPSGIPDEEFRPKVKIPPPVFIGLPGERPEAHL